MRIWFKIFRDNKMLKDTTITTTDESLTRTKKIFAALDEACYAFDLPKPIWLDNNIHEFQRINKTRFTKDSFIETINFDYLEIHIISE